MLFKKTKAPRIFFEALFCPKDFSPCGLVLPAQYQVRPTAKWRSSRRRRHSLAAALISMRIPSQCCSADVQRCIVGGCSRICHAPNMVACLYHGTRTHSLLQYANKLVWNTKRFGRCGIPTRPISCAWVCIQKQSLSVSDIHLLRRHSTYTHTPCLQCSLPPCKHLICIGVLTITIPNLLASLTV